ncbi:MAG: Methyltransferase type 12 [Bacteroidota bacterium]|nr:Methyltransferase type 12 [Bacteroidota bacterium]
MEISELEYRVAFNMDDSDPIQKVLNELYEYSTTRDFDSMYCHRMRLNLFHGIMSEAIEKKQLTKFDTALDIGANAGIYSKMISDFGFKSVYGIDIDDHQLDKAKKYFTSDKPDKLVWFENANAETLPTDKKYDFIVCSEVIEHTTNPAKVISNIKAMLTEGGIAVISLPNGMSLPFALSWVGYKVKGRPIPGELADHMKYPSYRTLSLFSNGGVKIIKSTGTNLVYWHLYKFVTKSSLFTKVNYWLAKNWPFKYFSQFFFIVITK